MVAAKESVFVPSLTLTVSVLPLNDPVTVAGFAGLGPSSYFWAWAAISARRQAHWSTRAMRVPSSDLNGSGILALAWRPENSGSVAMVQLAVFSPPLPVPPLEPPPVPPALASPPIVPPVPALPPRPLDPPVPLVPPVPPPPLL